MLRQTIATPGALAQNYSYADGINRLTSATEMNAPSQEAWQQTFPYDSYPALTPGSLTWFNGSNQWTWASYTGGAMTSLPQRTFRYDAENGLTASSHAGIGAIGYLYDGDGRRVRKTVGTAITTYVPSPRRQVYSLRMQRERL